MSSDETDDECGPTGVKTVRRVAKVWLSGTISSMWNQIENYHHDREGPKQGNKAFGRTFAPKNSNDSKAVSCLPRNYYNSLWWASLISVDQHHLTPGDEIALPDFTMYVCCILIYFHLHLQPSDVFIVSLQGALPPQSNHAQ
jgi:hypothetical protein